MPFGVMGGAYQPNGHVRFMTNLIDYNMDIQEALDGPRSFYDDGDLMLERGYNDQVRDALKNKGHKVNVPDSPIGGGQAIKINWQQGVLEGASDPRKDGCAIGY
jgi:gamma-glutamyltranspeptidase/glutathione hydrolase